MDWGETGFGEVTITGELGIRYLKRSHTTIRVDQVEVIGSFTTFTISTTMGA